MALDLETLEVGDIVRRVTPNDWPEKWGVVGKEYPVLEIVDGRAIRIAPLGTPGCGASANAFEFVRKGTDMTKDSFKVGDTVRRARGIGPGDMQVGDTGRVLGLESHDGVHRARLDTFDSFWQDCADLERVLDDEADTFDGFKVGDTVRRISHSGPGGFEVGDTRVVTAIEKTGKQRWRVKVEGVSAWQIAGNLELVQDAEDGAEEQADVRALTIQLLEQEVAALEARVDALNACRSAALSSLEVIADRLRVLEHAVDMKVSGRNATCYQLQLAVGDIEIAAQGLKSVKV